MKKFSILASVAVLVISGLQLAVSLSAAAAEKVARKPAGNEVIIGYFAPPGRRDEDKIRGLGGKVKHRFGIIPAISADLPEAAIDAISKNPNVRYVEPDYELRAIETVPDDPQFSSLWGLHNIADTDIDAPEAWDITTGSTPIGSEDAVIAVIDTGVDYTHIDLAANMWTNPGEIAGNGIDDDNNGVVDDVYGYNSITGSGDPMDDQYHGTHCAGTIGAVGNNATGVVGVNWTASIMAVKFLDSGGSGSTTNAIKSLQYIQEMKDEKGVNIIASSNSWGGGGFSTAMYDAIQAAGSSGMLFVAAAGNYAWNNDETPYYPASYDLDNIISVAATDSSDHLAGFSHYGPISVDLAAPGVGIFSTFPGDGYDTLSGTSMATPHVSGVVGLIKAASPSATDFEIKNRILASVDFVPDLAGMVLTNGRLNAYKAVVSSPQPILAYESHSVENDPDGSGGADPGETVDLVVTLRNTWADATGVSAELSTTDSYVTVELPVTAGFGSIPGGSTGDNHINPYRISIDAGCPEGHIASLDLAIEADGGYTSSDTFEIGILGDIQILFVDDDAGEAYEHYFTDALDANAYMSWDVDAQGAPTASQMMPFQTVIWSTGYDYSATLTAADQTALSIYLDGGGNLFLSSQDVLYDIGGGVLSWFARDYLHVGSHKSDVQTVTATGVSGDPISDGMSLSLTYPFSDWSDDVFPDMAAAPLFINDWGNPCALRYPSGGSGPYKVVFSTVPFEAISLAAPDDANILMNKIITWFQAAPDTEPPVISDATGNTAGTTGEPVPVSVTITDNVDVISATVNYAPIGGTETTVAMIEGADYLWSADVPVASSKVGTITYHITAQDALLNEATDPSSGTYSIDVTDNDAPSAITDLTAMAIAAGAVELTWSAAADNIGVDHYNVYRDAALITDLAGKLIIATPPSGTTWCTDTATDDGTTYYYAVAGVDEAANEAAASNSPSATADATAPGISDTEALDVTATSATIIWTTNEASDSAARYWAATSPDQTASDATMVTSHSIALSGLTPGETYYYEVQSSDAAGNTATDNNSGTYYTFATEASATVTWSSGNLETSTWVVQGNPAGKDAHKTYVYALPAGTNVTNVSVIVGVDTYNPSGSTGTDGILPYLEVWTSSGGANLNQIGVALTPPDTGVGDYDFDSSPGAPAIGDIVPGNTNEVNVWINSLNSRKKAGTDVVAINKVLVEIDYLGVPDTTAPVISDVAASGVTDTTATITWTTDEVSDSTVNFGQTTALDQTISDAAMVTGHSVALSSLEPDTLYYYEVVSADAAGNTATDNDGGTGTHYYFTTQGGTSTFYTSYDLEPGVWAVQGDSAGVDAQKAYGYHDLPGSTTGIEKISVTIGLLTYNDSGSTGTDNVPPYLEVWTSIGGTDLHLIGTAAPTGAGDYVLESADAAVIGDIAPGSTNEINVWMKSLNSKNKSRMDVVEVDEVVVDIYHAGAAAAPALVLASAGETALLQNFENPFNPETWIPFKLSEAEQVVIRIYGMSGRLVRTLDLGQKSAGAYVSRSKAAHWDGRTEAGEKVASGIYFYSIQAGDFTATRKMIVSR